MRTLNKRTIFTPNPRIYVFEITLFDLKSKIRNLNLYKIFWKTPRIYACLPKISLPYLHVMKKLKKLICKIFGHKYEYNFGWMPSKCYCSRCDKKWKSVLNPNYKGNPIYSDMHMWVEDK